MLEKLLKKNKKTTKNSAHRKHKRLINWTESTGLTWTHCLHFEGVFWRFQGISSSESASNGTRSLNNYRDVPRSFPEQMPEPMPTEQHCVQNLNMGPDGSQTRRPPLCRCVEILSMNTKQMMTSRPPCWSSACACKNLLLFTGLKIYIY